MSNYVNKVIELLGLEKNKEYLAKTKGGDTILIKIADNGAFFINCFGRWVEDSTIIQNLLLGRLEVINNKWKPSMGDDYYRISFFKRDEEAEVLQDVWEGCCFDYTTYIIGNCFRTREDAEEKKELFCRVVKESYEKGYAFDWEM